MYLRDCDALRCGTEHLQLRKNLRDWILQFRIHLRSTHQFRMVLRDWEKQDLAHARR